jgi:hypothetical protein
LKDFVEALDPVNAVADASDGFVWRLQSESGNATDVPVLDDYWLIVNMSTWRDDGALTAFMYRGHQGSCWRDAGSGSNTFRKRSLPCGGCRRAIGRR